MSGSSQLIRQITGQIRHIRAANPKGGKPIRARHMYPSTPQKKLLIFQISLPPTYPISQFLLSYIEHILPECN